MNRKRLLLTIDETADVLQLSRYATRELVRSGELPVIRVGAGTTRPRVRIPSSALARWLRDGATVETHIHEETTPQ